MLGACGRLQTLARSLARSLAGLYLRALARLTGRRTAHLARSSDSLVVAIRSLKGCFAPLRTQVIPANGAALDANNSRVLAQHHAGNSNNNSADNGKCIKRLARSSALIRYETRACGRRLGQPRGMRPHARTRAQTNRRTRRQIGRAPVNECVRVFARLL